MGALIRFIIVAVSGTAGVAAMRANPIAGFIFFLISLAAVAALLDDVGLVSMDEWPNILAATIGFIANLINLAAEAILGWLNGMA